MNLSQLPTCSSRQAIAALERLGAYLGRTRGSHAVYHRVTPDGRVLSGVVVLGKRELPKGTLRGILQCLDISGDEFRSALR